MDRPPTNQPPNQLSNYFHRGEETGDGISLLKRSSKGRPKITRRTTRVEDELAELLRSRSGRRARSRQRSQEAERANPYVGPRAFEEEESQYFFGRDQEIEILSSLVMARRVSLFFAQSGAGKSSLLRAGLIPELTRQEKIGRGRRARTYQRMWVLPHPQCRRGRTQPGQATHPKYLYL